MAVTVHAPVEGFTGVVAGVAFADGVAHDVSDPAALAYFRRQGYGIDGPASAPEAPEPADPRFIGDEGVVTVGTKLRDAAVDPRPEDFLPPTNAGEANPHGPEVVSPELHGSEGVRPVTGGPVAVDDPDAQEAKETAHAVEVIADGVATAVDPDPDLERPKVADSKGDWLAYAQLVETDEDRRGELDGLTKAQLVERYGDQGGEG